ncbi:MAG: FkbM family methyltransferase [Pyrinomonadaceae bacterium]
MTKNFAYYRKVLAWSLKYYRAAHDVEIETENGLLSVSNKDWLMGKQLFVHREFEIKFIERSIAFLQNEGWLKKEAGKTVLDIGANLGMIGIALIKKGFFDEVLAFEPSPDSFRLLKKNIRQNNLEQKIRCFNVALSSENASFEFEIAADNSGDNRVKLTDEKGKRSEQQRKIIEVTAMTFGNFLNAHRDINDKLIDLIWLDIQGHEGHFFKGAADFLKSRKVPCVSEFWGYGIKRAGMTQDEYCVILQKTFTHFYYCGGGRFELQEINKIKNLFKTDENPRHIENVIFVNDNKN